MLRNVCAQLVLLAGLVVKEVANADPKFTAPPPCFYLYCSQKEKKLLDFSLSHDSDQISTNSSFYEAKFFL